MATLKSLKAALREKATAVALSPTQPLSDLQYSDGFKILKQSGETKYQDFIVPQLSLLLTSLSNSHAHISVLEIGPGPSTVLGQIPAMIRQRITRYAAFEPNDLFATRLEESLGATQDAVSVLPGLHVPPVIHRVPFSLDCNTLGNTSEKFDLILFCHSMYGLNPKQEYIKQALEMVSQDGMVAVFHRDGNLRPDGLKSHRTASFPNGTTAVPDNDEVLDCFAAFLAGYTLKDLDGNATLQAEWRKVCRSLGRREPNQPGHILFSSPETMATFTRYATILPDLEALVPLASPDSKVKNWEARLHDPASIMRPSNLREVQECVRWAIDHKVGLTVVGGGHSGHCLWPGVVAVDMSAFDQIHILPAGQQTSSKGPVIIAETGCKSGEIIRKAMDAGLTVPLGARPSVGAGLWLQGGIGHLARLHGLTCDSIIGAIMISVANGQILRIGCVPDKHCPLGAICPENEKDLLWGLKGAGTNFGIVISVTFSACVAPVYSIQNWVYFLADEGVICKLKELDVLAKELPRNCSTDAYLWCEGDDVQLGITMFEASSSRLISSKPDPTPATVYMMLGQGQDTKTVDSMGLFETDMYMSTIHGGHGGGKTSSFKRCLFFQNLGESSILRTLLDSLSSCPSPQCYFHLLHGGGAVEDVGEKDTAFGCRGWNFACVVTGIWPREQEGNDVAQATVRWVYDVVESLLPFSLGVYGADLGPDPRDAALAAKAFGPNVPRLKTLKGEMDPGNVLAYACPFLES